MRNQLTYILVLAVFAAAACHVTTVVGQQPDPSRAAADPDQQAFKTLSESLVSAFNRADAAAFAATFLPDAELTDDAGTVHKGRQQIEAIVSSFFEQFPGAQLSTETDSIRRVGASLAIAEGLQTIVTADGQEKSVNAYTAVLMKQGDKWSYVSCQLEPADEVLTPNDRLQPLAWMVGDWVDEAPDAVVSFSCNWTSDGNFLQLRYESKVRGETTLRSGQMIGWDPLTQGVRSWVFDSDGGYGDGHWTRVSGAWIIKSTAVMPDGQSGSATIVVEPVDEDKFVMRGLDRILGQEAQPDFEVTIVRKPPQPEN